MSAAAAATAESAPPKGKKKLIIMIAAVLLVLGIGGGGAAVYLMKKKAAAAAEAAEADDEDGGKSHAKAKANDEHKTPPVFLPLEPFVVNLADKDADRFAQIGITLEIADAHAADELKAYMPAIRNGILMVLSTKNSRELMDRAGKEMLAAEVMRESMRPLGIDLPEPTAAPTEKKKNDASEDDEVNKEDKEGAKAKAKKKKAKAKEAAHAESGPVRKVHFSSFIIQ